MPRLFTGLEIPPDIAAALSRYRGGLPGARWVEPENYHVTLRFIGDIDDGLARDVFSVLGEGRRRGAITVSLDRLASFGGDRPRALFARIEPTPDLQDLQGEQERLMRRVGLAPEKRKFTPHVTLGRFRSPPPEARLASYLFRRNLFRTERFPVSSFRLYSSRLRPEGSLYSLEAEYDFVAGVAERV